MNALRQQQIRAAQKQTLGEEFTFTMRLTDGALISGYTNLSTATVDSIMHTTTCSYRLPQPQGIQINSMTPRYRYK